MSKPNENTAALVACGSDKRDGRQPSWAMYQSTLFEKSWAAACLCGDPFIMSAKHHLLTVDDRIDPYNKTLKNFNQEEKRAWAQKVLYELPDHYETIVLFGGRDYVDPILSVDDNHDIVDPYQDTSGNGQQMAVAGDIIEHVLDGGDITNDSW